MTKAKIPSCKNAHNHLHESTKEVSKALSENIAAVGVLKLATCSEMDLCTFLARTVIGQQLSVHAARTIWARVEDLANRKHSPVNAILTPAKDRSLKMCGISGNKRKALFSINEAISSKTIQDTILETESHQKRSILLTQIWGVGQWTADMTSLFYYGDPDIWPSTDGAVDRGLKLFSENSLQKEKKIIKLATPYRSYLALHMWKAVDSGVL